MYIFNTLLRSIFAPSSLICPQFFAHILHISPEWSTSALGCWHPHPPIKVLAKHRLCFLFDPLLLHHLLGHYGRFHVFFLSVFASFSCKCHYFFPAGQIAVSVTKMGAKWNNRPSKPPRLHLRSQNTFGFPLLDLQPALLHRSNPSKKPLSLALWEPSTTICILL